MSAVVALMEGIEQRLLTVSGLNVSPTELDNVIAPHAIVGVPPVTDYEQTIARNGKTELQPTVTVLTSRALDRPGQMQLARYASLTGDQSIPAAIGGDRTLGGRVEDCRVVSFRPLGPQEVVQVGFWGGVFALRALIDERLELDGS